MMINKEISKVVELVQEQCHPKLIILFGSQAEGKAANDSDIDIMIVENGNINKYQETLKIYDILRPLKLPIDVIVVDDETFNYWLDVPGNVYYEAFNYGKVLYKEAA
ncbi:MAG: nucleotidyltransferase domain-containing protein [Spirochaetia bacterium]|nr:nucleotidyltransferase domain-containing protein [Spirochaetia bacterium]